MAKTLVYSFNPHSGAKTAIAEPEKPVSIGASLGQFLVLDATRTSGKSIASSNQPLTLMESSQGLVELKTVGVKEFGQLSLAEAMKREAGFYGYDPGFPEEVLRRAAAKRIALELMVGKPKRTADLHAPYKPPIMEAESMARLPEFRRKEKGRVKYESDLFVLKASSLGPLKLERYEYDIQNRWWGGVKGFSVLELGFLDVKGDGVYLIEERWTDSLAKRLPSASRSERKHWFRQMGAVVAGVAMEGFNMDGYCNHGNWGILNDRCVVKETIFLDEGKPADEITLQIIGNLKANVFNKPEFKMSPAERKAFLEGLSGLAKYAGKLV